MALNLLRAPLDDVLTLHSSTSLQPHVSGVGRTWSICPSAAARSIRYSPVTGYGLLVPLGYLHIIISSKSEWKSSPSTLRAPAPGRRGWLQGATLIVPNAELPARCHRFASGSAPLVADSISFFSSTNSCLAAKDRSTCATARSISISNSGTSRVSAMSFALL